MEELFEFFKKNNVSMQITLDVNRAPTVHAFINGVDQKIKTTKGATLIEALENMKDELFSDRDRELEVHDRVSIIDASGNILANGTVYNVNHFREPSMVYAIDVDGYSDDVVFLGRERLVLLD